MFVKRRATILILAFLSGYRQVTILPTSSELSTPYKRELSYCLFSVVNIGGIRKKENKSQTLNIYYMSIVKLSEGKRRVNVCEACASFSLVGNAALGPNIHLCFCLLWMSVSYFNFLVQLCILFISHYYNRRQDWIRVPAISLSHWSNKTFHTVYIDNAGIFSTLSFFLCW